MNSISQVIHSFQRRYSLDNVFADIIASLVYKGKHLFDINDITDYIKKHKIQNSNLWRLNDYISELVEQKKLIAFTLSPTMKKYMATPKFRTYHMI